MNNFLESRYADIILMAKKICKSNPEYEEVAHFAISEFIEHERGQEIVDSGKAMNFISGIIHRSFHSSTSKYHTVYRQKGRMHSLPEWHEGTEDSEEYNYEQDSATESIQGVLEDMKASGIELWFRAVLFEMYVKEPNYSELARQTQIPRTSISKAVEEAKAYIQETLANNNYNL